MGEVIPQLPLRWPVLTSAVLHGLIAGALLLRMSGHSSVVPIGIEMLYIGESRPTHVAARVKPVAKVKAPVAKAEVADIKESTPPVEAAAPAQTGPVGAVDGQVVSALERYKYELRLFLESRKIYPEVAKRLRQTGKVIVHFKITADGALSEVNLEQGSSSEVLNRAAMDLVKGAPRFKAIPAEAKTNELQLSLPIEYIL